MDDAAHEFTHRVATNVRAEMARKKLSQSELAQRVGIAPSTLSRRLSCDYGFTTEELGRIAQVLRIKVEVLVMAPRKVAS